MLFDIIRTIKEHYEIEADSVSQAESRIENPYSVEVVRQTFTVVPGHVEKARDDDG